MNDEPTAPMPPEDPGPEGPGQDTDGPRRLTRSRDDRVIAGVCGGVARYFGIDPVIARIELPAWVAQDSERLALVHGAIVAQARITGDYPYALARADELAYVSGREREAFEEMVSTALLHAGVRSALSPKAYYKTLTRRGRRKHRV